jgi:hypothetical protein
MSPPKKIGDLDNITEELIQRIVESVLAAVALTQQQKLQQAPQQSFSSFKPEKVSTIASKAKDWVTIVVTLVMWFASITYVAGGLGQRVTELEADVKDIRDSSMQKDLIIEKLNGIMIRLTSVEARQQQVQDDMSRKDTGK